MCPLDYKMGYTGQIKLFHPGWDVVAFTLCKMTEKSFLPLITCCVILLRLPQQISQPGWLKITSYFSRFQWLRSPRSRCWQGKVSFWGFFWFVNCLHLAVCSQEFSVHVWGEKRQAFWGLSHGPHHDNLNKSPKVHFQIPHHWRVELQHTHFRG